MLVCKENCSIWGVCTELNHHLGAAVRVGRANRAVFRNRDHALKASGIAVDGRRGGEDDILDSVVVHDTDKVDGASDVDAVVLGGDFGGFTDSLGRG